MITGYEGDAGRGRGQARRRHRAPRRASAATPLGEEPGEAWAHGRFDAPYLRDSMLDVGVLVETLETATFWCNRDALYAAVQAALDGVARRRRAWCSATSRTSTRPAARSTSPSPPRPAPTRCRSGSPPRPPRATRSSPPAPPSPTTTPSAPTTGPGWPHEIGELGVSVLRAVKADLDPTGVLNPGVLIP